MAIPAQGQKPQAPNQQPPTRRDLNSITDLLKDYNKSDKDLQKETRNELRKVLLEAIEAQKSGNADTKAQSLKNLKVIQSEIDNVSKDLGKQGKEFSSLYKQMIKASETGTGSLDIIAGDIKKQFTSDKATAANLIGTIVQGQSPMVRAGLLFGKWVWDYRKSVKERKKQANEEFNALSQEAKDNQEAVTAAKEATTAAIDESAVSATEDNTEAVAAVSDVQDAITTTGEETVKAVKEGTGKSGTMTVAMIAIKDVTEAQTATLEKILAVLDVSPTQGGAPSPTVIIDKAMVDLDEAVIALFDINDSIEVLVGQTAFQNDLLMKQIDMSKEALVTANRKALDDLDANKGLKAHAPNAIPIAAVPEEKAGMGILAGYIIKDLLAYLIGGTTVSSMIKASTGSILGKIKSAFSTGFKKASGLIDLGKSEYWTKIFSKLTNTFSSIGETFTKSGKYISDIFSVMKGKMSWVAEFGKSIISGVSKIGPLFGEALGWIPKIGAKFGSVFGKLGKLGKLLYGIPYIGEVVMVLSSVYSFFTGFQDAGKILGKANPTLFEKAAAGFSRFFMDILGIVDWVLGLFGVDSKMAEKSESAMAKFIVSIPDMVVGFVKGLLDYMKEGLTAFMDRFSNGFLEGIKSLAVDAIKNMSGFNLLPAGMQQSITDKISGVMGNVPAAQITPTTNFDKKATNNQKLIDRNNSASSAPSNTNIVSDSSVKTNVVNNQTYPVYTRNPDTSHREGLNDRRYSYM